jgi:RNA polymerase sigma factor (sigma-70 family)
VVPDRAGSREESDREVRLDLVDAIRRLPPRQRAVIVLRFFDDVTEEQAASILGCSKGTIKSQTSKALASLRRQPNLSNLNTVGEPG